ncbi:MAG: DUF6438 domain-containing protein [Bacteroidia bacterium]
MKTLSTAFFIGLFALTLFTACKTKGGGSTSKLAADFSLELQHIGCRGNCPAYNLKTDAKGNATYNGRRAVEMMGNYTKTLDAKTVEAMAQAITDAHFWDFEAEYGGEVADLPSVRTVVVMDGKTKTVNDIRNAPQALKDLEAKLEGLFGKEGWTKTAE